MSVHVINRSHRLTCIPLNCGESIHLAPGEKSPPIEEFDLKDNARVEKMLKANLITVSESAPVSGAARHLRKKRGR